MALSNADFVKETSTTTGTGTYDLAGAVTGFQTFVAGVGDGNECWYAVSDGTDWEVGQGTVTDAAPDTLSRDAIFASSNSGAAVNWGAGTKTLICTLPVARVDSLPTSYISGLVPSVGTDTDHDVDITTGKCRSDDDLDDIELSSPLTIAIDAAAGINSIDTGSVAADTWYYIWLMKGSSGVGAVFSTSSTAPTQPSGYDDTKRLIGTVFTDGSANIIAFLAYARGSGTLQTYWVDDVLDLNDGTGDTTEHDLTLTVPLLDSIEGIISVEVQRDGATGRAFIYPMDQDKPGTGQVSANAPSGVFAVGGTTFAVKTDSSGQVHWALANSANLLDIATQGYLHNRSTM